MWEEDHCLPRRQHHSTGSSLKLGLGAPGASGVQPSRLLASWSPPCSSLLTLFCSGLIPHLLGDVVFLWGCNLLAHFINAYLVDDSVSDTPGGLGNDQNPGSQVGWNKGLPFFLCVPGSGTGWDFGILLTGVRRGP